MPRIHRLEPGEWSTLRALRLELLSDSPGAFGSTALDEAELDEAAWRDRLAAQAWFVALDGTAPVGVAAGGQLREPEPSVRTLRSLWVAPHRRGEGIAEQLVESVVEWARAEGAVTLSLWATDRALTARAFYAAHGFVATGEVRAMDRDPSIVMARFELAL